MLRNRGNTPSFVTKDGSRIWELFQPNSSPVEGFSVAEALVEPGRATEAHRHHASREIYYILEGEGTTRLGDEALSVVGGDAILISSGVPHRIRNEGIGELRILCVCCPPYSHDDTELVA